MKINKCSWLFALFIVCIPFVVYSDLPSDKWFRYEGIYKGEKFSVDFPGIPEAVERKDGDFHLNFSDNKLHLEFKVCSHTIPEKERKKFIYDQIILGKGKLRDDIIIKEMHLFSKEDVDIFDVFFTDKDSFEQAARFILTHSMVYFCGGSSLGNECVDFVNSFHLPEGMK